MEDTLVPLAFPAMNKEAQTLLGHKQVHEQAAQTSFTMVAPVPLLQLVAMWGVLYDPQMQE